jgi:hypothetical protein
VFLIFVTKDIYQTITHKKQTTNTKRVPCQTKSITFEKIKDKNQTRTAQKLLVSGNYIVQSYIQKSVYATSKLFKYISQEDIDNITKNNINKIIKTKTIQKDKVLISYYTRENDTKDPGKKTKKSKLYARYLVYEFKLNNKTVYKIQTDFKNKQGKDINDRIKCVLTSFMSI